MENSPLRNDDPVELEDQPMAEEQPDFDKLTLDEKKKLLQEYKHEKFIKEGTFVDAADTTHSYLMARVVTLNESTQTAAVNFDGWPSKWNINYKFSRIHPFLTRNRGYTGQRKVAIRNGAEYSIERIEHVSISTFYNLDSAH